MVLRHKYDNDNFKIYPWFDAYGYDHRMYGPSKEYR